jgi:hypothetical protein
MVGDPAYGAHVQRSNIHGNVEGLSGMPSSDARVTYIMLSLAPEWVPHSRMVAGH